MYKIISTFKKYKSDILIIVILAVIVSIISVFLTTKFTYSKKDVKSIEESLKEQYELDMKTSDSIINRLTIEKDSIAKIKSKIVITSETKNISKKKDYLKVLDKEYEILKSDSCVIKYNYFDLYTFISEILSKK